MTPTRTYDCSPTLTDTEVFAFCKTGYLMLEGVVADAINQRTTEYIEENGHHLLLKEDWFIEAVFQNPAAAAAVRSLLGANFALPIKLPNHRVKCPMDGQGWHRDGGSRYGPQVNHLQVFYYHKIHRLRWGQPRSYPVLTSSFLYRVGWATTVQLVVPN